MTDGRGSDGRGGRARWIVAVIAAVLVIGIGIGVGVGLADGGTSGGAPPTSGPAGGGPASAPTPTPTPTPTAVAPDAAALARAFLAQWVDAGRVVRRDQGGDTVSEGQAYGMLLAVVADDRTQFDAIWGWTTQHLQRSDGLLSWHWQNGTVVDAGPASDADVDAARALILAGSRWQRPDLTTAGTRLADAIAAKLTATTGAGRMLLPGLWATSDPHAYNPSYASPAAFDQLAAATGNPVWSELATGATGITRSLLDTAALPPDWAQIHAGGRIEATSGPGASSGGSVSYSYDAARLPVRFAEACTAGDRTLAAQLATRIPGNADLAMSLDLGGGTTAPGDNPLGFVARAAAKASAGDRAGAIADLSAAVALEQRKPGYYGAAWTALGTAMLTDPALGGCPPLAATGG